MKTKWCDCETCLPCREKEAQSFREAAQTIEGECARRRERIAAIKIEIEPLSIGEFRFGKQRVNIRRDSDGILTWIVGKIDADIGSSLEEIAEPIATALEQGEWNQKLTESLTA